MNRSVGILAGEWAGLSSPARGRLESRPNPQAGTPALQRATSWSWRLSMNRVTPTFKSAARPV